MRKSLILFFILCVLGTACSTHTFEIEKPDDLLPREQFLSILADIHLAEAVVGNERMRKELAVTQFMKFEYLIFEKHQIDTARYFRSYRYYLGDVDQADLIYILLVDTLENRKKSDPNLSESLRADSLKKKKPVKRKFDFDTLR